MYAGDLRVRMIDSGLPGDLIASSFGKAIQLGAGPDKPFRWELDTIRVADRVQFF